MSEHLKKFTLIVLSIFLLSILNGCQQQASNENKQQNVNEEKGNEILTSNVREAVWNQLTENDKKHIKGIGKDATVRKIVLRETMGIIKDKSYIGKQVYIVDFPANDNPTLGGVAAYADLKSYQLIGYGYRE